MQKTADAVTPVPQTSPSQLARLTRRPRVLMAGVYLIHSGVVANLPSSELGRLARSSIVTRWWP
jgi:hypothetical protein